MNNQFLQWLFSDSGAGWVFGIISAITLIASYIYSKKKPSVMIFKELRKTSLININSRIKERVNITFEDNPIDSIGYIEAELYNSGAEVIKKPVLIFSVPESSKILDVSVVSIHDNFKISSEVNGRNATLTLPYMNPVKDHNHVLRLSILLDGLVNDLEVTGNGEGWSTKHYRTLESKKINFRMTIGIILMFFTALVTEVYGEFFVRRMLGIDPWGLNFRVTLLFTPIYLIVIAVLYWSYTPILKSRPRSKEDTTNNKNQPTKRAADGGVRTASKKNIRQPRRR